MQVMATPESKPDPVSRQGREEVTPVWVPFQSTRGDRLRVSETACCGVYEWACQGGVYFILRYTKKNGYEETGRGLYREARALWDDLAIAHKLTHSNGRPPGAQNSAPKKSPSNGSQEG
ncbi:hypothetical protein HerbRD11066_24840 [Herbidospora sp. RD11066]